MRQPRSLSHSQHGDRQATNEARWRMLPQLTRPACPRHSRIHLHQHRRKCGRFIHQASSNTETSTVHGCSRASLPLKELLGFISFGFSFHSFCTGWPTLTRHRWHSFPHDQSSHEVFKETTVEAYIFISFCIHSFCIHFFWYMYLPTGCRKRGECCYCSIRSPEKRAADERTGEARR